jgi:hypothetical protein
MVFRHLDVVAESQENKSGNEKIKHRVFFYFPLPLSETSTKTFFFPPSFLNEVLRKQTTTASQKEQLKSN